MNKNTNWQDFVREEIAYFLPRLVELGFELNENQIHTKGERSAFRSKKIILLGKKKSDNRKVVIKISREKEGIWEVLYERQCREALKKINFNY